MSKPVLYYFDGRGRAEGIRWMLAACGIEVPVLSRLYNLVKESSAYLLKFFVCVYY